MRASTDGGASCARNSAHPAAAAVHAVGRDSDVDGVPGAARHRVRRVQDGALSEPVPPRLRPHDECGLDGAGADHQRPLCAGRRDDSTGALHGARDRGVDGRQPAAEQPGRRGHAAHRHRLAAHRLAPRVRHAARPRRSPDEGAPAARVFLRVPRDTRLRTGSSRTSGCRPRTAFSSPRGIDPILAVHNMRDEPLTPSLDPTLTTIAQTAISNKYFTVPIVATFSLRMMSDPLPGRGTSGRCR